MVTRSVTVGVTLVALLAGAAGAQPPQPIRRDSAGVERASRAVSRTGRSERDPLSIWTAPPATLTRGSRGMSAAFGLDDGSICVVDETPALRVFSNDGRLKLKVG